MKSETVKGHLESVGMKKKKMNGRIFRSLFKRQHIKETIPGVDGKLEGLDKLSHACSVDPIFPRKLGSCERSNLSPVISKVKLDIESFATNITTHGEVKVSTQLKNIRGQCPQNRKRVQLSDESPGKSVTENDDAEKRRRKAVAENVDPFSVLVDLQGHQETEVAHSEGGPSRVPASKLSQSEQRDNVGTCEAEERNPPSDEQKSLHSSMKGEIGRLCHILKLSEDVTYTMRRFLEYVILNHHMNRDSPAIIQAFQISLCWIALSILKQKVDKRKTLILAKEFLNYQCTEEQVHSIYSNMRYLKRIYLQCSVDTIDSGRGRMLAKEDINKDTVNVDEGSLLFSSVKMYIEENSTNKKQSEGNILLQQKRALKDNSSGSRVVNMISGIQKKCDKRMKKLIQKQQEEIQKLHQIWEAKKLKLQVDYKLVSAVIRSIYGEGSARMGKLKLLDGKFAKTIETSNLLKEVHLKDLMAEQLASRNEENRKAAHWLTEAKACCSSKPSPVDQAQPLGSQHTISAEGVIPLMRQHVDDKNLNRSVCSQANDVTSSDTFVHAPAKEVGSNTPTGTVSNLVSTNPEVASSKGSISAVVEQFNQTKHFASREVICMNLPNSRDRVSDELRSVELDKEFPPEVPEVATLDFVDTEIPEQFRLKLLDQDAPIVEDQGTLQIEVRKSALVETVTSVQSNADAQVFKNCEQLHLVPIDVAPSCNQSTAIEVENQIHNLGRNSSQTAEGAETEVLSRESACQRGENLEIQTNDLDIGSSSNVSHETGVELPPSLHNNAAMSQAVVGTIELLNQAVLPLGIDTDHLHRSSYPFSHPNHQVTSWNSPSLFVEPLQNEMEKICKETEQLEKHNNDMMSQLRSDCEKEIQEIIAQIHYKYEVKLQAAEAEFRLKKNGLDKNQKKVFMNKALAQAFNSKCSDCWSSPLPGMHQGIPSSFTEHRCQLPLQHPVRLPTGVSACQPAPSLQIPGQTVQAMQQLSLPDSTRLVPVTCQNIAAPPVQDVRRAMALSPLSFGNMSRPAVVNTTSPANLHFCGVIRAPAPHLQAFRPAAASSTPPATLPLIPSQPLQSPTSGVPLPTAPPPSSTGNQISSCLPEINSSYMETPANVKGSTSNMGIEGSNGSH